MELKDIPESAVIQQVKQVIKVTGLKIQRINTGCFTIGSVIKTIRNVGYMADADRT